MDWWTSVWIPFAAVLACGAFQFCFGLATGRSVGRCVLDACLRTRRAATLEVTTGAGKRPA